MSRITPPASGPRCSSIHRTPTVIATLAAVALLTAGTTSCGGDDDSSPTTEEFCNELQQMAGDDAGPYGEFYDLHPDPTLEDWAKDGGIVTENIQEAIDQADGLHPSEEAQPLVDDVLAAFEVVKKNSEDLQQAAKDGDQATADELETVNQDTNVPALMAAFQKVEDLCGAPSGS